MTLTDRYQLDNGEVIDATANRGHGGVIGLVFAKSGRHGTTYTASVIDGDGWTIAAEDGIGTTAEAIAWIVANQPASESTPVVVTPAGLQHLLPGYDVPAVRIAQEVSQPRMF